SGRPADRLRSPTTTAKQSSSATTAGPGGGPRYAELEAYVASLGGEFDLGEAFSGAPEQTRRPVDLLGLLEIAHRGGLREGEGYSIVSARRPDGTVRRFAFGSVTALTEKETDDD
ncbi:DUF3375 family protein, partial [Rathayibacter tanaceti]|uniref:DUF3375 family protein n=1 Tax=Rathayibacter tanaceti TaxID=1671680 RepID=UPI000A5889EB